VPQRAYAGLPTTDLVLVGDPGGAGFQHVHCGADRGRWWPRYLRTAFSSCTWNGTPSGAYSTFNAACRTP